MTEITTAPSTPITRNLVKVVGDFPKMKPEVKEKWLTALRSGNYVQTTHNLQTSDGAMCCLGVLCDIYQKETGVAGWSEGIDGNRDDDKLIKTFQGDKYYPSGSVEDWSGLNPDRLDISKLIDQYTSTFDRYMNLAGVMGNLNDARHYTFNDIADFVENNL